MTDTAVLLTCHGTVDDLDDVPAFLSNIRRGRPASDELIEEVKRRLKHIGGSPLMAITAATAQALSQRLAVPCHVAGRLWHPYPKDVIAKMVDQGVRRIVSLPLAPQSVHVYHGDVRAALDAHPDVELVEVSSYGERERLIDAFCETIDEALNELPESERGRCPIVLSAHSLPLRVLRAGDPYEAQFRAMAEKVGARYADEHAIEIAFQSQGASAEPWLGPDLVQTFDKLAADGHQSVLVAPIGFVADHVETLYDLDVEAPPLAKKAGLAHFARARAVGARPAMIDALTEVAREALGST